MKVAAAKGELDAFHGEEDSTRRIADEEKIAAEIEQHETSDIHEHAVVLEHQKESGCKEVMEELEDFEE